MIDIRNISYTEGTPLSPVMHGRLYQAPPTQRDIIAPAGTVISRAKPIKRRGNVIDLMATLGTGGLWKVYTTGGAYGSKAAVKTTYEEFFEAKGYPQSDLDKLWKKKEWKEWQPETTIPAIPSIQIPEIKLPSFDLEQFKIPLIIAAVALGAGILLPPLLSVFKK